MPDSSQNCPATLERKVRSILIEGGRVLSQSVDYDETLRNVERLLVPALADWCIVDLLDGDRWTAAVVKHCDGELTSLVRDLRQQYPSALAGLIGAREVFCRGRPELYEEFKEEYFERAAEDDRHLRMLRELKFRSGVVVPLAGHDGRLGAITLVSRQPRRYMKSDLPLIEEVGLRCGLALENARSHRNLQCELARLRRRQEERRESEEKFRLLVEQVRDYAIYMLDPHGLINSWNIGAERIKGYAAEEIIGKPLSTFYVPEDVEAKVPEQNLRKAIENGHFEGEGWRVRRDGSRFWAHVTITALRGEVGRLRGFSKITRDLTERHEAEAALRASEERLRLIIEGVTDYAIFTMDLDGRVTSWTPGAQKILGYAHEEIQGQSAALLFTPQDRQAGFPEQEIQQALKEGRAGDDRWQVRKDGSRLWANGVTAVLRNEDGSVRGFAKILRDMTEARRARKQLELRANQQAAVARFGWQALAGGDLQDLFDEAVKVIGTTLNNELCKVLRLLPSGQELQLMSGVGWRDGLVGHGRVSAGPDSQAGCTLMSARPVVVEDLRKETRFSGPPLLIEHGVVSGMSVIVAGKESRPWGVLGTHTRTRRDYSQDDVNFLQAMANILAAAIQRKETEQHLRHLNETLEQRVAERTADAERRAVQLQEMAAELSRTEERERRRLAEVLHDHLQQLLSASKLQMGRLRKRLTDPEIKAIADRGIDLLNQSIYTSRNLTVELSPPILYESGLLPALEWLGRWMEESHALTVHLGAEGNVNLDEDMRILAFQSVRELLFNSAKHAGVPEVKVDVKQLDERCISVEVADRGRGCDPIRAYHSSGDEPGFGLLSIRQRLELIGGRMDFWSQPGQGTKVTLRIPFHQGRPCDESSASRAERLYG